MSTASTADEAADKAKPKYPRDPAREVVETIVFVVVLVLLLKLFVTEAFVIPTGSMAETLYGYQKIITCPKCGHEFPVNSHDEVEANVTTGKKHPLVKYCCPNCRYLGLVEDLHPRPGNRTGDRVLVLKPLYHIRSPHRGDVVVFKYPEKPQENHIAANYIKRAMGFGGETIAIHRGDLFVTTSLAYPESALDATGHPLYPRPENPLDLWEHKYMYQNARQAEDLFEASRAAGFTEKVPGGFRIIRKEAPQLLADRRIVWDNDKQPKDLVVPPRWQIAGNNANWNPDNRQQPRAFSHNGGNLDWIHYQHLVWKKVNSSFRFKLTDDVLADLRGVNVPEAVLAKLLPLKDKELNRDRNSPDAKFDDKIAQVLTADELKRFQELIWNSGGVRVPWRWTDQEHAPPVAGPVDNMLGYNAGVDWNPDVQAGRGGEQSRDEGADATRWVGDLILECEVELSAGSEVVLELSKGVNRFRAKFGNGEVSLARIGALGPEFGNPAKPCKVKDGIYKLRFANVDCKLWVWVDDKLIDFGSATEYIPVEPNTYEPEDAQIKEGWTRINDIDAPASIGAQGPVARVSAIKLHRDVYYTRSGSDQAGADIYYVQPGHYMCLGDNSAQSSDSRKWGTVPDRLMLGKAVFVFWPAWPSPNRVGFIK